MVAYAMHSELRRVVDTIPELIWTAAADGSVEFVNQRWSEYTGLTLEQARGFGWHAAIWPDDLQRLVEHWNGGGRPPRNQTPLRRAHRFYRLFLVPPNA